ncbi:hypothetical protein T484DRAFT_1815218 [Baffinella frigidus]|nr:hypothetical protein T484DRAFT_1815218 [Cryptophyta sp. CCMP2293]
MSSEPTPTEELAPSTSDAPPAASPQPAAGEPTEESQAVVEKESEGNVATSGEGGTVENAEPDPTEELAPPAVDAPSAASPQPAATEESQAVVEQELEDAPAATSGESGTVAENAEPAGDVPVEVVEAVPAHPPQEELVEQLKQPVDEPRIVETKLSLTLETEAPESFQPQQLSPSAARQNYAPAHPSTPRSPGSMPVSPARSRPLSRRFSGSVKKLSLSEVTFERTAPFALGSPRSIS